MTDCAERRTGQKIKTDRVFIADALELKEGFNGFYLMFVEIIVHINNLFVVKTEGE